MTILKTLNAGRALAGLTFALLWIAATCIGGMLYVIPVGAVQFILGLDRLADPQRTGELTPGMLVLGAVLCGAACGLSIGLAQWFVLRRLIKRTGLWVAATAAGYASIGLLPLVASAFQPSWLHWAQELIIFGKMHWLARVEASWPEASWPAGAVTLVMFGVVLGIAQWLVLRGRVRQAGWWIAISVGGWALAALSGLTSPMLAVLLSFLAPAVVTAAGMGWLQRGPAPAVQATM